jgi:two-component system sensor histidine kinase PilS (NtrC family)
MEQSQSIFRQDRLNARLLRIYLYYRLILALLLLASFWGEVADDLVGRIDPRLFSVTAIAYVLLCMATLAVCRRHRFEVRSPTLFFILLTDIISQTLLMHASGGLASGLGYLLLVTVAAGSIFFTGQLAILVAAMASICIILESATTLLFLEQKGGSIFPAGILGILLFFTSLIFQGLNRALRTAQEQADRESEQSAQLQKLNELIVSRMLTGIIVIDTGDKIELINRAAVELLGGHRSGVPLAPGQDIHIEPRLYKQLVRWRSYPWLRTPPFTPKYGDIELQANFTRLDERGENRTLIFLEDLRAAAQHAQQLKLASLGRLTGSIAHEIRNPLGAISHASQLLAEHNNADPAAAKLTDIIDRHSRRVNHIIENVLGLSRHKPNSLQKFNLRDWLKRFLEDYREYAPDAQVELDAQNRQLQATFDPGHLQQILTNLLDNAVRHTRKATGEARARLRLTRDTDDDLPTLDVIDMGPGVPREHRGKLFEPFFTTEPEGTGLGLYIARELCTINFATLKYLPPQGDEPGCFRLHFAHPDKLLPRSEHAKTSGADH